MLSVNGKFLDWECNIGWSEYGMRLPLHGTGWNHQLKYCLPRSTFERACIVVEFISSILFGLSLLFHLSRRTIAYKNIRLNQRCIHRPSSSCLFSCSSPLLLLYLVVGFCQVSLAAQFMLPAIVQQIAVAAALLLVPTCSLDQFVFVDKPPAIIGKNQT